MEKKYICEYCGQEFVPNYSVYNHNPRFCNKICAGKSSRKIIYSKKQLEREILKIIQNNKRYTTKEEIIHQLHISSRTLTKNKISIIQLNNQAGYKKPKSIFELLVWQILEKIFPDLVHEKSFEDCLSPKGFLLWYDFYSPSNKLLIEADGTQHFDTKNPNYREYYHECDIIKNNYAKENGYTLIRIPYKKNVTEDYILKYISC